MDDYGFGFHFFSKYVPTNTLQGPGNTVFGRAMRPKKPLGLDNTTKRFEYFSEKMIVWVKLPAFHNMTHVTIRPTAPATPA